jgi:TIR domain
MFDVNREYKQVIDTASLKIKLNPIEDEIVQKWILKGLLNIRRKNPKSFNMLPINPEGFCLILGIPQEQFIFNASLLVEDKYVIENIDESYCIDSGDLHITSRGVNYLSTISQRTSSVASSLKPSSTGEEVPIEFKYDVAISFAGEDRKVAQLIAEKLQNHGIKVFYDDFEKSSLWGKNLYEHLNYIYSKAARYCVMLLSEDYENKTWTNHERRAAQARAFREKYEYILPIRIDKTEIPGLLETVGYISLEGTDLDVIVELIINKLKSVS